MEEEEIREIEEGIAAPASAEAVAVADPAVAAEEGMEADPAVAAEEGMEAVDAAGARPMGFWARVWDLYADGFRNMTVGKYLWAIIIVKLAVMFLVLKLFFFPDLLSTNYDNDADRAEAVRSALTKP